MRDREAIAFRQERKTTHARRRFEGFDLTFVVARADGAAGRPGNRAVARDRDSVDPLAFFVGDFLAAAFRVCCGDAAVIAAGDEPLAVAGRDEDRSIGMRGDAALLTDFGEE